MNETIGKLLEQDKSQKWFFITTGVIFGGLATYLFYTYQTIPSQLETMWITACGFIAAGFSKGINKIEQMINKDLDGDGDIGVDNSPVIPDSSTIRENLIVAEVPKQEVVAYDAECDAASYKLPRNS